MIPAIGRIVLYTLRQGDVDHINHQRRIGGDVRAGSPVREGDVFPMMITVVHSHAGNCYVNGQVALDGNDLHWATDVQVGEGPGTFAWPVRA